MPSILLAAFSLLISGEQFTCGRERVHDALLVLRRALRGKIMRLRYIVGGKLVCDPKARAIRSVLMSSVIVGKFSRYAHFGNITSPLRVYQFQNV